MTAQIPVEKKKLDKAPLSLRYMGDRVLRQPTKRFTKIDDEVRRLARQMLQTMYTEDGIGLAAPQAGINKQMIVVDPQPDEAANPPIVLINPVIMAESDDLSVIQEGCLSIPGVFMDVTRSKVIEVSYKDDTGRPQKLRADGLLARVILHEIDHLNGILFVDRVDNAIAMNQELVKHGFSVKDVRRIK
ncbi:peptide deformylase [Leptolyngbya sp. GB1-A1]|uniref:peptide deformylase n=1 Tax=Leptolyngbya sp. GB1-A1 TaxID=2933908 RepID=UPI00329908D0